MAPKELPCVLYKLQDDPPLGLYCKIQTEEEYDKAKADDWQDDPPKDWNNVPDPNNPGGTLPHKQIDITEIPAADRAERKARTSKPGEPPFSGTVLEGSVVDVSTAVGKMTDVQALQNLRRDEVSGKNRRGALEVIDARIEELQG